MLYQVVYVRIDVEGEVYNMNTKNTRVTWFSLVGLCPQRNSLKAISLLLCKKYSIIPCVTMNPNMSIYR